MKATAGLTRQQRKSKSKLATATRKKKKTEELPSVRKRDGSTAKETRGGGATPCQDTMPVEQDEYDGRDTFHQWYMQTWGDQIGSMEQRTAIPSMRRTDCHVAPRGPVHTSETLQVFTVRISPRYASGLSWPLHVYGVIAARDHVDYKRNIIFERGRDDCHTITEEAPYLELTGPTRAVVLVDPVYFEFDLKVKGTGQSDEDQDLIFVAYSFRDPPRLLEVSYTGKMCTLELTIGHIFISVEATISMKVIDGSWPDGFRGFFAAKTASIDGMEFALLLTGDDKLPVADDGMINLQRHVVCAEIDKEEEHLEVSVEANNGVAGGRYDDALIFTPQRNGRLSGVLSVGSCEIEVTVAWSLVEWCY
ncbi:hypothetical protein ACQ4PT_001602 [Festuca glaucescens]